MCDHANEPDHSHLTCTRDGEDLDELLERQADMIRYLQQHNTNLGRRILELQTSQVMEWTGWFIYCSFRCYCTPPTVWKIVVVCNCLTSILIYTSITFLLSRFLSIVFRILAHHNPRDHCSHYQSEIYFEVAIIQHMHKYNLFLFRSQDLSSRRNTMRQHSRLSSVPPVQQYDPDLSDLAKSSFSRYNKEVHNQTNRTLRQRS